MSASSAPDTLVPKLIAYISNQAKRLPEAIAPVRETLRVEGTVPRWGMGYVQAGHVLLSRNPKEHPKGVDLAAVLEPLQSDYIIAWAGEEDGLKGTANTQPFRYRSWLYAQTASTAVDVAPIVEHMPGYLRRNIRGKTLAEGFFHLMLSLLHDSGGIDDPDLDPHAIGLALRDASALATRLLDGETGAGIGSIAVSNSRSMVVAHFGGDPLFVRSLKNEDPKLSESQRYRAVLAMTGTAKPGDGFEAIPPGSAVVVHRNLDSDIVPLGS